MDRNVKSGRWSGWGLGRWLLVGGLVASGVGGAFLPWIWYESVALQLTAPGLAEFVKFLPEIRSGAVEVQRLFFLLPLFLAMVMLPLAAANGALGLPAWLGGLLRLVVVPLALAGLSPVWTPAILMAAEFRLQTMLGGLAIGLAVIAPVFKRLPLGVLATAMVGGGAAALILPAWQFRAVQAGVAAAYQDPVFLGWGWQITAGGIILSMVGAVWAALVQPQVKED